MTGYARTDLVDATPVRAHIHGLRAANMTLRTLAAVSGVPLATVNAISQGTRHTVTADNAAAITAVATPVVVPLAGCAFATKPRRQAQALYRIGYDTTTLHRHTGIPRAVICKILAGCNPYVSTGHAQAIDRAYRALAYKPGPSPRARDEGARKQWASPLAWEPHTIGDPAALPDTGGRDYGRVAPDTEFINLALDGDREIAVKLRLVDRQHAYRIAAERGIAPAVAAELLAPSERSFYRTVAGDREPVAA